MEYFNNKQTIPNSLRVHFENALWGNKKVKYMDAVFTSNKHGRLDSFYVGQKVECSYYHEYERSYMKKAFRRPLLHRLLDKSFSPVKVGVVVGSAGFHPYWLSAQGGEEEYLLVRFKEYKFDKPIPISCCCDAEQACIRLQYFLEESIHRIGEKGYSMEAFLALSNQLNETKKSMK